jgi:hypothetical protein
MERLRKLQQVVGQCTLRLLDGETLDVAELAAAHPDLIPELAEALERLRGVISPKAASKGPGEFEDGSRPAGIGASPDPDSSDAEDPEERDRRDRDEFDRWISEVLLEDTGPWDPTTRYVPDLHIPGYEIREWIGRGGFGIVWLARHTETGGDRAIKVIPLKVAGPAGVDRLRQEASVMDALGKHRNRVLLYDCKVVKNHLAIIMEYVAGGPLSAKSSPDSPMPWRRACKYIGDVAEGLVELHQACEHAPGRPSGRSAAERLWPGGKSARDGGDFRYPGLCGPRVAR